MFQSAPLLRGATLPPPCFVEQMRCFNPRPSCEGRLYRKCQYGSGEMFQSAPLLRGATNAETFVFAQQAFQSAPLLRGATPFLPAMLTR